MKVNKRLFSLLISTALTVSILLSPSISAYAKGVQTPQKKTILLQ